MRVTDIQYQWKDDESVHESTVVILNDSAEYALLSEDDSFDSRIFYYFQNEAEFESAFDPTFEDCEFVVLSEQN